MTQSQNRLTRYTWRLLFSLLVGVLLIGGGIQTALAQDDNSTQRTLEVTGTGSASGSPDQAFVELGVEITSQDIGEAVDRVNMISEQIVTALQEMGIAPENIQTLRFNVYSQFPPQPQPNAEQQEQEYVVSNIVQVTVEQIDQISSVIETALDAGANRVFNLQFGLSDPDMLIQQAREEAVANARMNAEALADQFGVTLGEPLHIREGGGVLPPISAAPTFDAGGGGGGPVISQGQLSVTVQVGVVYSIDSSE